MSDLSITATESDPTTSIAIADLEPVAKDPLPAGVIEEATNPEDMTVQLRFRYTEDCEGALFFFITHDGHFIKGFSQLGMALTAYTAATQTWKREYRTLLPQICKSYALTLGTEQEPTESMIRDVIALSLMKVKMKRPYRGGGQVFYDFTDTQEGHWCQDILRGYQTDLGNRSPPCRAMTWDPGSSCEMGLLLPTRPRLVHPGDRMRFHR